jgi:hypothetical protein
VKRKAPHTTSTIINPKLYSWAIGLIEVQRTLHQVLNYEGT